MSLLVSFVLPELTKRRQHAGRAGGQTFTRVRRSGGLRKLYLLHVDLCLPLRTTREKEYGEFNLLDVKQRRGDLGGNGNLIKRHAVSSSFTNPDTGNTEERNN